MESEIREFLRETLKKQLNLTSIEDFCPFYQYGMKSIDAVFITGEMEKFTNWKISPTIFFQYHTIDKLTEFILNGGEENTILNLEEFKPIINFNKNNGNETLKKAYIFSIGTTVPKNAINQMNSFQLLVENSKTLSNNNDFLSKIQKMFDSTCICERYFVIPPNELAKLDSTAERNEVFNKYAPSLAAEAASLAIQKWGESSQKITHVLSVSCSGTVVPGIEFLLVDLLGLRRNVVRLGINFMGCFGGLAALRTAYSMALSDSSFRILVVCVELCSLHVQKDDIRIDNLVAGAIFSDGAAAMIIGSSPSPNEKCLFEILKASCFAIPNSTEKIRWDLSNTGWKVGLESDIGFLLGQYIDGFCKALAEDETLLEDSLWAIHPGGKSIIELIESRMNLNKEQTKSTWEIYKKYGNMSSTTILFILEHLLQYNKNEEKDIISLAFGPGLSIEGILLKKFNL